MYLKRVVMHGFKSFADRTVVELDRGVTAIVGPNGCGKSNIADAIKWVLGEQSPKSLRATSMQDVLFEGADTRPPMSFCEVNLLFSDCEAQLGTAFAEVEITRRVERDGGSDYAINGKSCRLKDIQQLFRDTGIGRVAYSFLQQGQIDKLLSANPVERRTVFEEAAGISGFKVKREETLKKLQQTEENLLRVGDILREVSSSMTSLKRQAAKAVRAQRYRRELKALDLALAAYDSKSLEEQIASKKEAIAPMEVDVEEKRTVFQSHEETLKTAESELSGLLERQQNLSNEIFETRSGQEESLSHIRFLELRTTEAQGRLENLAKTLEALKTESAQQLEQKQQLSEKIEQAKEALAFARTHTQELSAAHQAAQKAYDEALGEELTLKSLSTEQEGAVVALRSRLSALELERHGLEAALSPLNAQRETVLAEKHRIEDEASRTKQTLNVTRANLEMLTGESERLGSENGQLKEKLKAARVNFEGLQHTHSQLTAEKELNEALNRRYEGFGEASRALLEKGGFAPLVEGLDIEPKALKAIEALLAIELDSVYPTEILNAVTLGALRGGERVALRHWVQHVGATTALPGLRPAIDFVKASGAFDFIRARLEGCYVCEDTNAFENILQGGSGVDFVAVASLDGAMVDGRGLYSASHESASNATYLARSARLKELAGLIAENEAALHAAQRELATLDEKLAENEMSGRKTAGELAASAAALKSLEGLLEGNAALLGRLEKQLQGIDAQSKNSRLRLDAIEGQKGGLEKDFEAAATAKAENDERIRELTERLASYREARDNAYASLSDARLNEANTSHLNESLGENAKNIESRLRELEQRENAAATESERLRGEIESFKNQSAHRKGEAEKFAARLEVLEVELKTLKEELSAKDAAQSGARTQLEELREALGLAQNTLMRAKLELNELQSRKGMLVEDFARRFGEAQAMESLDWRALLYEAEVFAKADEATLELETVTLPSVEELAEKFPTFDRSGLFEESQQIRGRLENLGPINESALEDYKAQEGRFNALKTQADDLGNAKVELEKALMELNAQSSTLFAATFETIRANFGKTFEQLFGGGKADLVLADPNDPLNSGIEIMARPPGTQLKSLNLLSGGQKTMTAVALLFAIYQVKPSPFCVLDELDAPLDDANIGRFLLMLKGFTSFSQFVIITHNKRTMAASDVLYGVTMQERGVSRILSMRLQQAETYSKPAPKMDEAEKSDGELAAEAVAKIAHEEKPSEEEAAPVAMEEAPAMTEDEAIAAKVKSLMAGDDDISAAQADVKVALELISDDETLKVAEKVAAYSLRELEKQVAAIDEALGEKAGVLVEAEENA